MYLKNLYRSRALVTQRNPTNTDFKGEKEKKKLAGMSHYVRNQTKYPVKTDKRLVTFDKFE